jgi:hypothetical protein
MTSRLRSLSICGLIIFLSSWCTLYNKYIFEHVFPSSNCLLLVQNIVTVLALAALHALDFIQLEVSFDKPAVICGVVYSLNVMTGLWSLVYVNMAMFGTLKRGTAAVSWVIEYWFTPTCSTKATLPAVLCMFFGASIAGSNDLQFSLPGYLLALISCVAQAVSFELGRRLASKGKGLSNVLFVNSTCAIAVQMLPLLATGEFTLLRPSRLDTNILGHFFLNSVSCLLMNYSIFLNCQVNSPLAHAVTGNVKGYVTTFVGSLFFTSHLTFTGWAGVLLNCAGAGWFSLVKLRKDSGGSPKESLPSRRSSTSELSSSSCENSHTPSKIV